MGSPIEEAGRYDSEGPVREVKVLSFAMAKYPISRGEYSAFVKATGYDAGNECWTFTTAGKMAILDDRNWRNPGYPQDDRHPAVCLNWNDAKAYATWLSRKSGKSYRLPSEAEWEYAARAGTVTSRYWGDDPDQACQYANVMDLTGKARLPELALETHSCSDGYAYTSTVGKFKPNAYGLHDMLGNVLQWTEDCWHVNYTGAPSDGKAWSGGDCSVHALRGAPWSFMPRLVRSASRNSVPTEIRNLMVGFRVAKSLP